MRLSIWSAVGLWSCLDMEEPPAAGPEMADEPIVHVGNDWLFSTHRINRIDLMIDEDGLEILRAERRFSYPRRKVRAEATIDGEWVGDIGVRMRGGIGSFSRFDYKPKLELDLNEYTGERFHGLESLSLNNMISDCSGVREALAYAAYGELGLATSRTGYAQLFVNGLDYGLMLVLETQDDRWLRRNFMDGSGNFYDGKYVLTGFWPRVVDFDSGTDDWFDLEEGQDVGFEDISLISEGIRRSNEGVCMDPELRRLVDWEQFLTMMRVEQWTGNDDAYGSGPNNYRVYFEPGWPMVMAPWDTDGSFPTSYVSESSEDGSNHEESNPMVDHMGAEQWEAGGGRLLQVCLADETCRAHWDSLEDVVTEELHDGSMVDTMDSISALTKDGWKGDPRNSCPSKQIRWEREAIRAYLVDGSANSEGDEGAGCSATNRRPGTSVLLAILLGLCGRRRLRSG